MTLPVAQRWFRRERMADGVALIWEHHVSPDVYCNIWFVRGRERNLLFDSGLGVASLRAQFPFLDEKPLLCVASHSHFDHMGGHHEFAHRLGHAAEADVMAAPTRDNTLLSDYVEARHFSAAPYDGFDPLRFILTPAPLTGRLDDGDVVDLGDRVFRVLHLPGHSPGSIALFEEKSGLLLSGDAVYDGELLDGLHHSSIPDYVESMHRLKDLPVATVRPGHYDSFGRERLRVLAEEYIAGRRKPGCPAEY